MTASEKKSKGGDMKMALSDDSLFGRLRRIVAALAAMLILAMVSLFFVARTEWARSAVENKLSALLGTEMTVGRTAIGWPYELVLNDVAAKGGEREGHPWLEAQEVRIALGLAPLWRVTLYRPVARVAQKTDGADRPEAIRRLADLTDLSDLPALSRAVAGLRDRLALRIEGGRIEWLGADGESERWARGACFRMEPIALPSRTTYYHYLSVYDYQSRQGVVHRDFVREWLADRRNEAIEIGRESFSDRAQERNQRKTETRRDDEVGPTAENEEPTAAAPLMKRTRGESAE